MACPRLEECPLSSMFTSRAAELLWRANYCDAEYPQCARYQLTSLGLPAPPDLLPNGRMIDLPAPRAGGR